MRTPGNADVLVGITPPRTNGDADKNRNRADEDVGAPRDVSRGWYSRGYLPHCDATHLIQSVTYRLADSLPQAKLAELKEELGHLSETHREIERRKRIEEWLDAGMGCCALAHPEVARCVENAFLRFHGERYHLHAWCIMPNHVHVLIEPLMNLAAIVQCWKSYTARRILRRNAELALKIPSSSQFWMREYWDRYIRDAEHYRRAVEYIHLNPVKAGLCQTAEAWPWSEQQAVWLTQMEMGELFDATKQNISLHLKNIFEDGELEPDSVVKESLTTAADGKRYKTLLYNLDAILAVGYRVRSPTGIKATRGRDASNIKPASPERARSCEHARLNKRMGMSPFTGL